MGLKETAEKVNNPHYYSTANGNTSTVSGVLKMLVVHVFNFNFEVLCYVSVFAFRNTSETSRLKLILVLLI